MRIVFDTNVIIDVLANREPFADDAESVLNLAAQGTVTGAITANTITDIAYLMRKKMNGEAIQTALMGLMEVLDVVEVGRASCIGAFGLHFSDYEDALLAFCAKGWNADFIVTRNGKDFIGSPVPAIAPGDFLQNDALRPDK